MLKTVSSTTNAIGALNYKGTWNASANTPTLVSGTGTKGDYYVVSVAGATALNGISNWGIGDWATFNGSVWQRVEGGANGNFVDLDVSGLSTLETAYFGVNTDTTGARVLAVGGSTGGVSVQAGFGGINGTSVQLFHADLGGVSGAATVSKFQAVSATGRSINAAGTINALGTDYAEYMFKADDAIFSKGEVCGVNASGKLTKKFSDSVAFVVKSTSPSFVGGDNWASEEKLGFKLPAEPKEGAKQSEWDAFNGAMTEFSAAMEEARKSVDRIAYCGQVPVNVQGATPGQFIIAVNENDAIKGQSVSNPTFEQYQSAVGKVIAIEADGRARIIVKIS
jgi:hypothetical protein